MQGAKAAVNGHRVAIGLLILKPNPNTNHNPNLTCPTKFR